MKPDPRLALLCYLCWYAVIWIQRPIVLGCLLLLQLAIFVSVGGLRSVFWRVVKVVAIAGVALSALAYLFAKEPISSIVAAWGKWGSVVLATVGVASVISLRDLFVALRWLRVPRDIAFPLGVALKFLPVAVDETRRCVLSLRARGLTSGGRLGAIVLIPRLVLDLWIPVLANVLERAQRSWFSMELRGFWDTLQTEPRETNKATAGNILVVAWALIPVGAILVEHLLPHTP